MKFYHVETKKLFDPCAYIRILITDDIEAWKHEREFNGDLICYAHELTAEEAEKNQYKVGSIQIYLMHHEED